MAERGNLYQSSCIDSGRVIYSPGLYRGRYQWFTGQRGGRFKPGQLKLNAVSLRKIEGTAVETKVTIPYKVYYYYTWYEGTYVLEGDIAGVFLHMAPDVSLPTMQSDISLTKALAKLNRPDLDVGLIIGELSETIGMLRNPFESLRRLAFDFRKNAKSKAKQKPGIPFSKVLSSTWLEYVYGVLPVYNDIQAIRDRYRKVVTREESVLRRSSSRVINAPSAKMSALSVTPWVTDLRGNARTSVSKSISTHIYFRHNRWADNYAALTSWGVNPFQILDVAYAIMPYSFVLNWFLDVGSWLKAIQPHPHLNVIGGVTSVKTSTRKVIVIQMANYTGNSTPMWVPCNASFDYEESSLDRSLITSWVPTVPIGAGLNTLSKAINSAAMVWQKIPLRR